MKAMNACNPASRSSRGGRPGCRRRARPRRGTILITAMWIIVIVGAMALVFARSMRVEVIASGNRLDAQRAATAEKGAEAYVLSVVEAANGDALSVLQSPCEAMPVGSGYFWILRPNFDDDQAYLPLFAITDEASKANVNTFSANDLMKLPMTEDVADAIVDWRDADSNVTGVGAESDYYLSLPSPYRSKDAKIESIDELLLVRGLDDGQQLWGLDRDHDGTLSQAERNGNGPIIQTNNNQDTTRGFAPFVTCYTSEANVDADGNARINLNDQNATTASNLQTLLQTALPQRAAQIMQGFARGRPYSNVFDFAMKTGLTADELPKIYDRLTTVPDKTRTGLVNINTAPPEVLASLPGLTDADVMALVAGRPQISTLVGTGTGIGGIGSTSLSSSSSLTSAGASTVGDVTWVMQALTPAKAVAIGSRITGRSYQYSADIVAASADGRAFKRVRIVVDASQSPAKIIYRKDLTSLGWPLPPEVRDLMGKGQAPPNISGTAGYGGNFSGVGSGGMFGG